MQETCRGFPEHAVAAYLENKKENINRERMPTIVRLRDAITDSSDCYLFGNTRPEP